MSRRAPARRRGVLGQCPPHACPDARPEEITAAVAAIAVQQGIYPGRGGEYDKLRDCYIITGKDLARTKVVDHVIEGELVAGAIFIARALINGVYERAPVV